MNNFNAERIKENHMPIFNIRLAKYLMNNGARCVDVNLNKMQGYENKTVFYFVDDGTLQDMITDYKLIYANTSL